MIKHALILTLATLLFTSCSVDKNSDRIADSTESMQSYIQLLEKHIESLDGAFLLLISEFKSLNGDIHKLAEISPQLKEVLEKFSDLDDDLDDSGNPTTKIPNEVIEDVDLNQRFDQLRELKIALETLDTTDPKIKAALYQIDKILFNAYQTSVSIVGDALEE